MIKRILMVLSDADSASAEIQHGVELARYHGAELTAVTLVDMNPRQQAMPVGAAGKVSRVSASGWAREMAAEQAETVREQAKNSLQLLRKSCEDRDVLYRTESIVGDAFEFFISKSRYYDLFLCGSRIVEHSILDSSGDALVRLVNNGVRPIISVPTEFRPLRRVMIAYSGSVDSAKTMKLFIQSQLLPVLSLKIVTFDQQEAAARQLLAEAGDYCKAHGYHAEVATLPGMARDELLKHAEDWAADLIVLGNSDRSALTRLFFGDPSLSTIRDAHCALYLGQ